MSDIQKEMFDNDLDPIVLELDSLAIAKDAYMTLNKCDEDPKHNNYQKKFDDFQTKYNYLSESDKQKFERWKEENGFDW